MKIVKWMSFPLLAAGLLAGSGCVVHDGARERSWTVGHPEQPIAAYVLAADSEGLSTDGTFDPTAVVDYSVGVVKRWVSLFPRLGARGSPTAASGDEG